MRWYKRVSILLILVFIVGLFPIGTFADNHGGDVELDIENFMEHIEDNDIVKAGTKFPQIAGGKVPLLAGICSSSPVEN